MSSNNLFGNKGQETLSDVQEIQQVPVSERLQLRSVPYGFTHSVVVLSILIAMTFYFASHGLGIMMQQEGWFLIQEEIPKLNQICLIASAIVGVSVFAYYKLMGAREKISVSFTLFYMKIACPIIIFSSITAVFITFKNYGDISTAVHFLFQI